MYIPPGMENAKITPHFTIREFASQVPALEADLIALKLDQNDRAYSVRKDRFIRLDLRLVERLEKIRSDNGNLPMVIHEGYRSVTWHRALTHNKFDSNI
ncbi:MAG TPA: hypothetical protein DC024_09365 [Clostridiales bacterium]|nr:hypothetical protein [Clostridiales bacterium]